MYLPKYYIKPIRHGETLGFAPVAFESRSWSWDPYDGEEAACGMDSCR